MKAIDERRQEALDLITSLRADAARFREDKNDGIASANEILASSIEGSLWVHSRVIEALNRGADHVAVGLYDSQ